jgi:hypothetical protein
MFTTFGYMCILIIVKWTIPWDTPEFPTSEAPSIIGQMIALPLKLGSTEGKVKTILFSHYGIFNNKSHFNLFYSKYHWC